MAEIMSVGWMSLRFKISDRERFQRLSRPEKKAIVLHEVRHIMQHGALMATMPFGAFGAVMFPLIAVVAAVQGEVEAAGVAGAIAGVLLRIAYLGFRGNLDQKWAEWDADRFARRFCPRGTEALWRRMGLFDATEEDIRQRHPDYLLIWKEWQK